MIPPAAAGGAVARAQHPHGNGSLGKGVDGRWLPLQNSQGAASLSTPLGGELNWSTSLRAAGWNSRGKQTWGSKSKCSNNPVTVAETVRAGWICGGGGRAQV